MYLSKLIEKLCKLHYCPEYIGYLIEAVSHTSYHSNVRSGSWVSIHGIGTSKYLTYKDKHLILSKCYND